MTINKRWFPPRLEQNKGSGEAQRTQGAPQEWWSKCWVEEILQWPDLIIMMLTMRIYDDIIVALLVMKPETMRHSTNSWLKIGTSVLARPACKAELGNADQNPNQQREIHQRCTYWHAFSNAHSWAFSLFVAKPNIQFFPLISFCRYKE